MPMRSPSETAESARRVGSYRGGPGRCLLWRALVPAASRRSRPASLSGRRSAPPLCGHAWPREHLIDQDISRFDAKADDPSQVPYHGVWLGLGLLLQSFLTSRLDLFDLADDEAQARHIAL